MHPTAALQNWIVARKTSGAALARRVGCHKSRISRIKTGKERPRFDLAVKLHHATGLSMGDLGWPGVTVAPPPAGLPADGAADDEAA